MRRNDSLREIDVALTAIGRLARTRNASLRRQRIAEVALDDSSVHVLHAIAEQGPLRLGQLSAAVDIEVSQLSKKVRRLVDDGLVSHNIDPAERRAVILGVTPAGRKVLTRYRRAADRMLADALATWSDEELTAAAAVLHQLSAAFHAADAERPARRRRA